MSNPPKRIAFAGTPVFAATILARMLEAGSPVSVVLTQPDRPAGRGRKVTASAVKRLAQQHGLPVLQPASLRSEDALAELRALAPEVLVVAAYGLILPQALLDLPDRGCLNVHASLLPRWRGAAPVARAIMAGDTETGVCIMQMEAGLDTGPVRHRKRCPIGALQTAGELEQTLVALGADALLEVLGDPDAEAWRPVPQPETGATYAAKITREDARIDFTGSAAVLARRIRALNPARPVAATVDGVRIQLLRATSSPLKRDEPPGTLCAMDRERLVIACGDGSLELLEARVARGKAAVMDAAGLGRSAADLLQPGVRLEPV